MSESDEPFLSPVEQKVADKVDQPWEVPWPAICKMMAWKYRCKHVETTVYYREDVAGGDFIVWKEICNRCSIIVTSGSGKYVESPVIGRTTTISPTTNYNDGWYINWDMVGKRR